MGAFNPRMARKHKNKESIDLTPEQKATAIRLKGEHPDWTPKQISDFMGIPNGAQISGLLFSLNTKNGQEAAKRNLEKVAADEVRKEAAATGQQVQTTPTPTGNPLVDRVTSGAPAGGSGQGSTIASTLINASQPAPVNMTRPNSGGKVVAWRISPVDLSGYLCELPYPYNPHDLGQMGGEGDYDVKISDKFGVQTQRERIPASYGPARNPRGLYSETSMNMNPAPAPAKPSAVEEAQAGLVKAVTEKVLNPAPKEPTAAERFGEKMMEKAVENMANPPKPATDPNANRAMTLDDWIRAQQAQQVAHDKRMEEIRVEAAAQAAKIKAEADAAVAKQKADADAAIAKMKAEAEIKAAQDKEHFERIRTLEKEAADRREAEMKKAIRDAEQAVGQAKIDLKKELDDQRARDAELNKARFDTMKAQADAITKVAEAEASAMRSAKESDSWLALAKEFKPVLEKGIEMAGNKAAMETNPGLLNKVAENPAAMAVLAGANNAKTEGAVDNVSAALASPEFKAFLEDYCLGVETHLEDANYTAESFARPFVDQMFFGPNRAAYSAVADFIGKRQWKKMRPLIYSRLSAEQKKLLDNPKHENFYQAVRIIILRAINEDTRQAMQNMETTERVQTEAAPAPEPTPATSGDGEKPPADTVTTTAEA